MAIRKPFFVEPLAISGITAGSAVAGHPASHLGRFSDIGMTWKTDGSAGWVKGTFGGLKQVDFVSMVSANAQPGTNIQIRLGTSEAQADSGSPLYGNTGAFISPATTTWNSLYHSHHELPAPVNASHWRIDISGHSGAFEAAAMVAGLKFEPMKFYNSDYERGAEDLGGLEISRNMVLDETPGEMLRTIDFTLAWQLITDYETRIMPMLMRLGTRKPVFLCFDPEPSIYRQNRTYMGPMRKPPVARGVRIPTIYSQDFQIRSFI